MLLLAGVQAMHSHAATDSGDHDCSVCSVIHAGAVVTSAFQVAPLFAPSPAPFADDLSTQTLLLVNLLYIRPPPSL
jgi:hypothetical protein